MPALKSAVMVNIQSHTRTVLEFPPVGIVRFYGNNSNGKSVLVKVLSDVVSNAISRPSNRRSIIRRGHSYGELMLQRYDGATLFIRISEEAASTYAELTKPDYPPVRRYLADKSIPLLVKEFGWHYNGDHGLSLNIHQDVDGFLFVDTKKAANYDLLNSARSDQYAEAALESITDLLKATKKQRGEILHCFEVAQATYTSLKTWDVEEEESTRAQCLFLAQELEAHNVPPMPELPPIAYAHVFPVLEPMPALVYPRIWPTFLEPIPDIVPIAIELQELRAGICPTCKRKLIEEGGHTHEISC